MPPFSMKCVPSVTGTKVVFRSAGTCVGVKTCFISLDFATSCLSDDSRASVVKCDFPSLAVKPPKENPVFCPLAESDIDSDGSVRSSAAIELCSECFPPTASECAFSMVAVGTMKPGEECIKPITNGKVVCLDDVDAI